MERVVVWLAGSAWRVLALYAVSVLVCASLFCMIEGRSFAESLWWAGVTSLTIGYGDITPTTTAGRVVAMMFSHLWIFGIAPLIVTNMLQSAIEDRNSFTHEEQEEMKATLRFLAVVHGKESSK